MAQYNVAFPHHDPKAMDHLFWLPDLVEPSRDIAFGTAAWPFVGDRGTHPTLLPSVEAFADPTGWLHRILPYGPSGCGKTLLGQAILALAPETARTWAVTGTEFRRLCRQAYTSREPSAWWQRLLAPDYVLLDGLEETLESESTREMLEQWLDRADVQGQRLVMTSRIRPSHMAGVSPRLASRLCDGVEIELPSIPSPVIRNWLIRYLLSLRSAPRGTQVVERIDRLWDRRRLSVAAVRGLIDRLVHSSTPSTDQELLDRIDAAVECSGSMLTLHDIARQVSRRFGVSLRDIRGASRRRTIARVRQIAMFLCREMTRSSYRQIGEYFGRRDHSTAVHAHQAVRKELEENIHLSSSIQEIRQLLQPVAALGGVFAIPGGEDVDTKSTIVR